MHTSHTMHCIHAYRKEFCKGKHLKKKKKKKTTHLKKKSIFFTALWDRVFHVVCKVAYFSFFFFVNIASHQFDRSMHTSHIMHSTHVVYCKLQVVLSLADTT